MCLFEIVITLYKVEKNKPWISFPNQSNIEEEWNKEKKTIRKIKGTKTKKKNIWDLMGKHTKPVNRITQVNMSNSQNR